MEAVILSSNMRLHASLSYDCILARKLQIILHIPANYLKRFSPQVLKTSKTGFSFMQARSGQYKICLCVGKKKYVGADGWGGGGSFAVVGICDARECWW